MSSINIQDFFLEQAKARNYVVTVHLVGKVRLMGTIKDYDQFSVTINSYGQDQLIYKQAISTIQLPRGRRTSFMFAKEDGKTVVKEIEPKPRPASTGNKPRPFQRSSEGGREPRPRSHNREQRPYEQRRSHDRQLREPKQYDNAQPREPRTYDTRNSQPREQRDHNLRPLRPYDRRGDGE